MKKLRLILLVVFCALLLPSAAYPQQSAPERKRTFKPIKREPRVGDKISGYPKFTRLLMIGSSQTDPAYDVSYQGKNFTVTANDKIISYISTTDASFKTPEGIGVGDTLEKVLSLPQRKLIREPGWAFYVYLESGWRAAFTRGEYMTEEELPPTAKVKWLFRRD